MINDLIFIIGLNDEISTKKKAKTNRGMASTLPNELFDLIASCITTRDRLLVIERVCKAWRRASETGHGWRHNLDLSWCALHSSDILAFVDKRICKRSIQRLKIKSALFYKLCAQRRLPEVILVNSWPACHSIDLHYDASRHKRIILSNALFPNVVKLKAWFKECKSHNHLRIPEIQSLRYLSIAPENNVGVYKQAAKVYVSALPHLTHLSFGMLMTNNCWEQIIDATSNSLLALTDYGLTDCDIIHLAEKCLKLRSLGVVIRYPSHLGSLSELVNLTHLNLRLELVYSMRNGYEAFLLDLSKLRSLIHLKSLCFSSNDCEIRMLMVRELKLVAQHLSAKCGNGSLSIVNDLPIETWLQTIF